MITMTTPNEFYKIRADHPGASELRGDLIGEIQRLRPGDTIYIGAGQGATVLRETYTMHLSDPNHPRFCNRLTLPANGHIVIDRISRSGWTRICSIVGAAVSEGDNSWRNVQRTIDGLPELEYLRTMTSPFGLVTAGAYR